MQNASFDAVQPGLQAGRVDVARPMRDFKSRHEKLNCPPGPSWSARPAGPGRIVDTRNVKIAYLLKTTGSFQPTTLEGLCGHTLTSQASAFFGQDDRHREQILSEQGQGAGYAASSS